MGSPVRNGETSPRGVEHRACCRFWLIAVTLALTILAGAPSLLISQHRVIRHVRAWTIGAELLDDNGVILQSNRADCGHTCLMMALQRFGRAVPFSLVQAARNADVGLTVAELIALGEAAGLTPEFHRVPKACLRRALTLVSLPVIVLVGPHYLLVDGPPVDGFITFIDPALGRLRAPIGRLEREWREAVVTFTADSTPEAACPQNPLSQGETT